jgi:hypothetical protein
VGVLAGLERPVFSASDARGQLMVWVSNTSLFSCHIIAQKSQKRGLLLRFRGVVRWSL